MSSGERLVAALDRLLAGAGRGPAGIGEALHEIGAPVRMPPATELFDRLVESGVTEIDVGGVAMRVLARPGERLDQPLLPGDLLIRRALGEGRLAHVSVVAGGSLVPGEQLEAEALVGESAGAGHYAQVVEAGFTSVRLDTRFARRVTDGFGRLPRDQMVLRPLWEGAGEANEPSAELVRWVQTALNEANRAGLSPDGDFGSGTRRALRAFQRRRHLNVDRRLLADTMHALAAATGTLPPGVAGTVTRPGKAPNLDVPCPGPLTAELEDFETNKSALRPPHGPEIDRVAQAIVASHAGPNPVHLVCIVGHTDSQGGAAANITLGQARADTVRAALIAAVDARQAGLSPQIGFWATSAGESSPKAPNRNAAGRAQNRRVTIALNANWKSVEIKDATGTAPPCQVVGNGGTRRFTAVGTPAGGTFQWTANGHISIVGAANAAQVQVRGDTPSGALDDSELRVSYRHGTTTVTARITLTVVRVVKIKATIQPTAALTGRPGVAAPANHDLESTRITDDFPAAESMIVLRGAMRDIALEAEVQPAGVPLQWDVRRAADDHASLGAGTPTLTPNAANTTRATLRTDETGSFLVRAFASCNGGAFQPDDPFVILPVVLASSTLQVDNSATHVGHIANPTIVGGTLRFSTGSFNVAAPATEAIHMNATIDVVTGGPDGRRLIDRVFGGWVNNERAVEDIRGNYAAGHVLRTVFSSTNGGAAGGQLFVPGDPAPVPIAPPLLDSGRGGAGSGGDTATLTRSRIRSRTVRPVGERWIVEAIDSPGQTLPVTHPGFGTAIRRFHFELRFAAFLCLWTNRTAVSVATGDPADRVYATVRSMHWDMLGEWTISPASVVAVATPMSVTISNQTTHAPMREADGAGCEVRPPPATSVIRLDGRT